MAQRDFEKSFNRFFVEKTEAVFKRIQDDIKNDIRDLEKGKGDIEAAVEKISRSFRERQSLLELSARDEDDLEGILKSAFPKEEPKK